MGWCLLLTLSRGSWVGLAASMAFIATLKYRRIWLLIFVVAAGVFVLPEAEAYVAHLLFGVQMQDKAVAMRLGEYTDALKLIARYPLLASALARRQPSTCIWAYPTSIGPLPKRPVCWDLAPIC